MSVSGRLAQLEGPELRRQLQELAHELVRRSGQVQQPYVWYLPTPAPYLKSQLYRKGSAVELKFNGVTTVTVLDDQERWGLIAWLIAQDGPVAQEASTKTTT